VRLHTAKESTKQSAGGIHERLECGSNYWVLREPLHSPVVEANPLLFNKQIEITNTAPPLSAFLSGDIICIGFVLAHRPSRCPSR
jgi:hypothetical protein